MATKDRTALKDEFKNGNLATGERFADLIDSMKVVQEPVADPAASGTSLSFIDSISQDADGKITATKKTLDLANAHELNPFKGWWKTGDTLPTSGFDGAYLYFKDTDQTPAVTTIFRWNGTGYADTGVEVDESNVQTFETGQAVNEVAIDGTQLVNPASNALAKAEDITPLAAKMKGITLTEDKVQVVEDTNYFDAKYIVPTTGSSNIGKIKDATSGNPKNGVLIVNNLDSLNIKSIRFLGFKNQSGSNGGSAWGFHTENITSDNIDTVTISDLHDYESGATTPIAVPIEINVPSGAKSFACTIRKMNNVVMTLQSFYCYLQTGEGVGDMIANVQPDEQLSTTSEKPIANKTITNFIFDNFTREVERGKNGSYSSYQSGIFLNGNWYNSGANYAKMVWYPVTPGKTYIVNAWQIHVASYDLAYAGFYSLPNPFVKSDIKSDNVCKGKNGDDSVPYTYRDESLVGTISYIQDVILTAPEGATHIVLVDEVRSEIEDRPVSLREISVSQDNDNTESIELPKYPLTPTPNALVLKNVLKSQNRDYYIEEVDLNNLAETNSYALKSYIDRKIATIPEGKHFMMWTDAHIDYGDDSIYGKMNGLRQNTVPVMAYIKEKLGIQHIIYGGDTLGVTNSKYKAVAIVEKYMNECYEAFGRGLINVFGNHDFNAPASKESAYPNIPLDDLYVDDVEGWKRMFQPMELYGDVVYAENVLQNIYDLFEEPGLFSDWTQEKRDNVRDRMIAWAKMTYYIDDPRQKIRYFVVVGDDPATVVRRLGLVYGSVGNFMPFIDFFADALINIPKDYDFCFISHQLNLVSSVKVDNNPWYAFYKIMSAYKTKSTVNLGNGTSGNSSIFYYYKNRSDGTTDRCLAKYMTSHSFDDNGKRTYDMSTHQGSGRVFALGGHYHLDRAAFISIANGVFVKNQYSEGNGINGDTSEGNVLYDLEEPANNAYFDTWDDAILNIEIHCTTIGGSTRDESSNMIAHRYKKNGEWVEDPNVYDCGADWTGNEGKVYQDTFGHRKSVMWPIGGYDRYLTADAQGTPYASVSAAEAALVPLKNYAGRKILIKEGEQADLKVYYVKSEKVDEETTNYSIEIHNDGRGHFSHYFDDDTNNGVLPDEPISVNRIGNVNEICCDVITITDDNHVVCTRFGAGFDRDYKLPSIPSYSIYAETAETEEQTTENAGE